ncbi:shikimate kinase [Reinekea sp. MED297]|uniref:Shikimate kinase n=2 Tax=Reinekea TaxID=230494 RepID=A4BAN6_9GAMM|nr:shikimate kinase [Reinekea sp. MED297] [Reinekea blandensis MED297]
MGAGKSTIGRLLSEQLNLPFVDLDREIEDRAGASIPWIFDIEGEAGFRERECAALVEVFQRPDLILATGGGCVLLDENRQLLSTQGHVVYLKTSVEQQLQRTAKDKNRPLLQTEDPESVLRTMAEKRNPLYEAVADSVIVTNGQSPKLVVQEIISQIQVD